MKTFTTLSRARIHRRAIGGSIIRILADPDEIYIVTPSFLNTNIMSVADDGTCDGSIKLIDLSTGGAS